MLHFMVAMKCRRDRSVFFLKTLGKEWVRGCLAKSEHADEPAFSPFASAFATALSSQVSGKFSSRLVFDDGRHTTIFWRRNASGSATPRCLGGSIHPC
jgi:hypothetical protein